MTAFLLCGTSAGDPPGEGWAEVVAEVQDTGYPPAFVDSLKAAYGVGDNRGLRRDSTAIAIGPEELVFEAAWGPLKAGFCRFAYAPDPTSGTSLISARAATNRFVSTFVKVRDYLSSTVDSRGSYALFFQEHINEGRYRAQRWQLYDQRRNLTYTSKKDRPPVECVAFSHDILSAFYYIRTQRFSPGDTVTATVVADGKCWPLPFYCEKRAVIRVKAGTFNCVSVAPVLVTESRLFTKKDQIVIWLTDDDRHLPVMIKSKIKVGSIVAELIWFSAGRG